MITIKVFLIVILLSYGGNGISVDVTRMNTIKECIQVKEIVKAQIAHIVKHKQGVYKVNCVAIKLNLKQAKELKR